MKVFNLASLLKVALTTALVFTASVGYSQKVTVKGGYNGWGYQPGYEFNPQTGWARISGPSGGGFNFRPSSGYTSPSPLPTQRMGGYPNPQPRVQYNYGRPYIVPNSPNFRPEPRGGWYSDNWKKVR